MNRPCPGITNLSVCGLRIPSNLNELKRLDNYINDILFNLNHEINNMA